MGSGRVTSLPIVFQHVLTYLPTAIVEGHDQVLKIISEAPKNTMAYVRAGEQVATAQKAPAGILTAATDWQLPEDLEKQLKLPSNMAVTTLRIDTVHVCKASWEASERKLSKYTGLVNDCQQ